MWHHHIRHQQIDRCRRIGLHYPDSVRTIHRFQHRIALLTQHLGHQGTHVRFIFDDEHRLRSPWQRMLLGRRGCRSGWFRDLWQVDLKGRPPADLAIDPDVPAVLLDDPITGRQT